MAPLPANNTDRYFLDYQVGPEQHTLIMRTDAGFTADDAVDAFSDFLTAISSLILLLTINGMRFQAAGSNVSLPVEWTGDPSFGSGAGDAIDTTKYISYVGRGADGHRVRVTVFGVSNPTAGTDYRYQAGENSAADAGRASLSSHLTGAWQTISSENPVWNNYANVGINAYWRNKTR